jgi:hypothetical protein
MGQMPTDGQGLRTLRVPDPDNASALTINFQAATNLTLGDLTVSSDGTIRTGTVTVSDASGGATYTEPDGTSVAAKIPGKMSPPINTTNTEQMNFNVPKGKWVKLEISNVLGLAIMNILGPLGITFITPAKGGVAGTGAPELGVGFMPPTPVQVPTSTH